MENQTVHILVVSNRGPFSFSVRDGEPHAVRGSGGLVTALSAVARQHEILWISCALSKGDREWLHLMGEGIHQVGEMSIRLVQPDAAQYHAYYNVISNPLLWFVQHQLHDTPRHPIIDENTWKAWSNGYTAINRQLAQAVAESIQQLEGRILVLVQDYHLYLFPRFLRELVGDRVIIQSFLHIPWPSADAWRMLPLPMRRDLITSMLHADRVGFQTERDTRRFLQTCVDVLPDVRVSKPWRRLAFRGREVEATPYPISVDVEYLEQRLDSPEVQQQVARLQNQYEGQKLILRVDRVEPSKNILRGFLAFRNLLLAHPEYCGRVDMLALLVPSRTEVTEYRSYLREVMALVGEINATLSDGEWEPIRVLLGNNYDRAVAAFTLYDVLLVNPLADGMNLVAKEGAALNRQDGVVILSEEAGVAEGFGDAALLVSPYDVYGTREALRQALDMPEAERHDRATKLKAQVRQNDIHHWFRLQLEDAEHQWNAGR
ncbi:MAG: trehalose-6-phosphate synthase [Anaerolineae bacterium]|uniref:alpha,alpha-trehalose-phosphate synthase (UDP-forming) n=1 Tax=Candidatus Flexifilum breve TaxID=3140694 RepID=UPI001AC6B51C|nr:trehalose-6-phosphate synthase [Chloroflexota bacterium]MBN8638528.1 trehalose-6-phosphate synthase [Anaerolineae bacterium]